MSTVSDLNLAVVTRIGTQRLVELTNESGTATTVDDDVLNAACNDSIGDFQRITGIEADSTNTSHMSVLIQGVIFYLEDYKARDGGIMTSHGKRFYSACESIRQRVYISPTTNSNLTVTQESSGSKPDMDKNNSAFSFGRISRTISEVAE